MGNSESMSAEQPAHSRLANKEKNVAPKTKRRLIVQTNGYQGLLEVEEHHSCFDLRQLAKEAFDDDMLPPGEDFYFQVQGVRLAHKQEAMYKAYELLGLDVKLVAKNKTRVRNNEQIASTFEDTPPAHKKARVESTQQHATTVSPDGLITEEAPPTDDDVAVEDTTMEEAMDAVAQEKSADEKQFNETEAIQDEDTDRASSDKKDYSTESSETDQPVAAEETFTGTSTTNVSTEERDEPTEEFFSHETDGSDGDIIAMDQENDDFPVQDENDDDVVVSVDSVMRTNTEGGDSNGTTDIEVTSLEEDEDLEVLNIAIPTENDPHQVHKQALATSTTVLKEVEQILEEHPDFCSEERRQEWTQEIRDILNKSAPKIIVGVLGNTGVGKSSLLNALLDEAAVLPTSGSRGCTAAVVELRFNTDLTAKHDNDDENLTVYKGEVEFITQAEWARELKVLVDECSTHQEKTIYARPPEEQRQPDAAAAWSKINQVYGRGTMESYHGEPKDRVYNRLISNLRVSKLLMPTEGKTYNSVVVKEGHIEAMDARNLLQGFTSLPARLCRSKKKWAQAFRKAINGYVYRTGNGDQPQTWPLIRKVVLEGPWPVLSTGACLVDLPGVRDANAARAKVSEHYLQNCNEIWIVAPIKRAVDDGTAKELLGEQFKRRLLMDGAYGNVSFICTQTDDCEATETMRDHQDVAVKLGCWEKISELSEKLGTLDKEISDLQQQEEDLKANVDEATDVLKASREELKELENEASESDCETSDSEIEIEGDEEAKAKLLEEMRATVEKNAEEEGYALLELHTWKEANNEMLTKLEAKCRKLQRKLKSLCALVRNEYSKTCLQDDFRAGLEELTRKPDEEEGQSSNDDTLAAPPIPDDYEMDVYCISANDYLKVQGIKPSSDGPPNTFSRAVDTQVPSLRAFVHETTAKHCAVSTEAFVNGASDLLDRVKLVASDARDVGSGRLSRKCRAVFENEVSDLDKKLQPVVKEIRDKIEAKVRFALRPSLESGAAKGNSAALSTVHSWGSKNRRRKNERSPQQNGLYWSTYFATARRSGVYVSASAGAIDLNQELCDPMEKEFSSEWQQIMDSSISSYLRVCEARVLEICSGIDKTLATGFVGAGLQSDRVSNMVNTTNRTCTTALKASFQTMKQVATSSQRDLNRSLLPMVQERMKGGYDSTINVPGGPGKFDRMKNAMASSAGIAVDSMFSDSTKELLASVGNLIEQIASMIAALSKMISRTMERVYSVCWDDQSDKTAFVDPEQQEKIRKCRDKLLPDLHRLSGDQGSAMKLLGIEREELGLDVMGVASWEDQFSKKLKDAENKGEVIDLLDSDDEFEDRKMPAVPAQPVVGVKLEPGSYI